MNDWRRIITVGLGCFLVGQASAALFTSKETKTYKKYRDAARTALKAKEFGAARTNFLAAHAALSEKGFKNFYYKGSLVDLAGFFTRRGRPDLGEPYAKTLLDYEIKRRGTNHIDAARAYFVHGQIQRSLYRFAAAEESLQRANHTARWKLGKYSVGAGYTRAVMGQLRVWMKRDEEAVTLLEAGLKQMGTKRTTKYYGVGGYEIREYQQTFKPKLDDVGEIMLDYSVALRALGRTEEADAALQESITLLNKTRQGGNAIYYAILRMAATAEARGDVRGAEQGFRAAAKMVWDSQNLSAQEKLKGNELLLEFYIRNGQDSNAGTQEQILFDGGVSDDRIHELSVRAEALMRARAEDRAFQ